MNTVPDTIVLSSDVESRRQLKRILDAAGIDTICSSCISDCQEILASRDVDLIFCDSRLADGTYRDLLRTPKLAGRKIKVVLTSRLAGWEEFLEAARLGAFDMIAAPCVPTEVEWVVSQVVRVLRTGRQAARLDMHPSELQLHS
jgi:DNA-binding NtrC family response regulator